MRRSWLIIALILTIPFYAEAATISSGGGHQIQDEGATPLAQKPKLNFTGDGVSVANPVGQDYTEVNIGQAAIPEPNYYVAGYNADGELINYSTGIANTLYHYPNILTFTNIDFETDVTGWTCNSCGVSPQSSTTTYVTGTKSMFFDAGGAEGIVEEAITVMAETPYTISAWVYDADATNTVDLRIRDTSYTGGASLCSASTTAAWTGGWFRLTCATPATNTDISLYVQIVSHEDATDVYVDDVQLSIQDVTAGYILQDDGFVTCKISNCVAFNGAQTNINTADSASLEPTTGLTLSAWVFPTSEKTSVLIDKGAKTQYTLETVSDTYYDGKVKFTLTNNSSGLSQTTTNAYYIYRWTHVVAQISGTAGTGADDTVYFYINGTLVDTFTGQNYQMPAHATGLYIGSSTLLPGGFSGYMDDIRIYSAAISAADITAMYNSGSGIACSGGETSIVACWNVNEVSGTTAVSLPAGFNGTLTASTGSNISGWRNCKLGNCIQFDGIDDYVEVKHGPAMDFTDNFSFSFWLYRGVDTGGTEIIFSMSDIDSSNTYRDLSIQSQINSSDLLRLMIVKESQGYAYLLSTSTISVGQWYHIVLTKSNSQFQIYLNNVLDANGITVGTMGAVANNKYSILLGLSAGSGLYSYGFSGKIDELQIYNSVLGTSEISALYNSGAGVACSGSETGLTACWHFNESTGLVTYQTKNQTGIGSDANNCITSSTPCRTLQAAINKIPQYYAGTAVVNMASVSMFPENSIINGYNNSGNYTITLRGYNNPTPNQFTDVATLSGTSTGSNTADFPKDTLSLFNNTSIDSTSSNGTLTNSPTWTVAGGVANQFGWVDFVPASSQYITMGNAASLEATDNFTAMAWFKVDEPTSRYIMSKRESSGGFNGWHVRTSSDTTITATTTYSTTSISITPTVGSLGTGWHHIAYVINNKVGQLYLDGTAVGSSGTGVGTVVTSAAAFTLGSMNGVSNYMDGGIDEVAIFNTALSQTQIRTYCGWSGSACGGYWIPDNSGNLIAVYHLDDVENNGTSAPDTAEAAFNGDVTIGDLLYIDSGPGSGTWAKVQSKQSATQLALATRWGTVPTSSSTYQIFPNKYLPKIHSNNGSYGLQIKNSSGIGIDRLGIVKAASNNIYAYASKLDNIYRSFFNKGGYIGLNVESLTSAGNIQYNFGEYNAGENIRIFKSSTVNTISNNITRGGLAGLAGYWSSSITSISTNLFDIAPYAALDLEQNFTSYGLAYNRLSRSGYAGLAIAGVTGVTAIAPNTITSNYSYGIWLAGYALFNADFYGGLLLSDFEVKSNNIGIYAQKNASCFGATCTGMTFSGNATNIKIADSDSKISSAPPTGSGCGTSPSVSSTSRTTSGSVTIGGGTVTSCTLTFPVTWNTAPFCTVSGNNTGVTLAVSTSTTALTITSSATMNGHIIRYNCGLAE